MKHDPDKIAEITRRILNGTEVSKAELAMVCEHVTELNRAVKTLKLCRACNLPLEGFGGSYCTAPHSAARLRRVVGRLCDTVEDLSTLHGNTEIETHIAMIIGRLRGLANLPPST
jgi:hypothetical protein